MQLRIGLSVLALSMAIASSARAVDVTECATMLADDDARLACYDRIVTTEIKRLKDGGSIDPKVDAAVIPPPAAAKPATPAPVMTAPAVAPGPKSYKRVDPADVRNTPGKWLGRDIEFASASIYWVADDDLRILTTASMTLFGKSAIGDPADLAYLRENCETSKEADSSKCRVRVRFAYSRHSEDNPNGYAKRVILAAPQVELARLTRGRR